MTVAGPGGPVVRDGLDEDHPRLRGVSCSSLRRDASASSGCSPETGTRTGTSSSRSTARDGAGCCRRCTFYLFLLRKPPDYVGHNPVAGSAYIAGLRPVFPGDRHRPGACAAPSAERRLAAALVRLVGAALRRPVSGALDPPRRDVAAARLRRAPRLQRRPDVASIEENGTIDSIFSGYKWVPRSDLDTRPYRWINRGRGR